MTISWTPGVPGGEGLQEIAAPVIRLLSTLDDGTRRIVVRFEKLSD
jgi:hypothetical protein